MLSTKITKICHFIPFSMTYDHLECSQKQKSSENEVKSRLKLEPSFVRVWVWNCMLFDFILDVFWSPFNVFGSPVVKIVTGLMRVPLRRPAGNPAGQRLHRFLRRTDLKNEKADRKEEGPDDIS